MATTSLRVAATAAAALGCLAATIWTESRFSRGACRWRPAAGNAATPASAPSAFEAAKRLNPKYTIRCIDV
jgi:hypothetical protein